jgi:hypothetical protein
VTEINWNRLDELFERNSDEENLVGARDDEMHDVLPHEVTFTLRKVQPQDPWIKISIWVEATSEHEAEKKARSHLTGAGFDLDYLYGVR